MATRPGLRLRTTQRLAMTPEMRQGMALLAMPGLALGEELVRQAEENPLLKLESPRIGTPRTSRSAFEIASETVAETISLGDHLRAQLGTRDLSPDQARAARAITWALDERGYLEATLDEIADASETSLACATDALHIVQSLDPPGIAARDLRDCLALQLVARGIGPGDAQVALTALEHISTAKWRAAEVATGLDRTSLKTIAALLPELTSVPAAAFSAPADVITPDLELTFLPDGTPQLRETRDLHPTLTLDETLLAQIRQDTAAQPELQRYAQQGARLMSALSFRSDTLLRVGASIIAHQRSYLDPAQAGQMGALTRHTLAGELSLHASTIGRAIAGKFLTWPGGTLPLSAFFPTQLGEDGPSAHTVQRRLSELVRSEQPGAVLSDDAITRQLQREGVDIARRTVAKYRGCLGIAPSHIRKRRKARVREDGPKGRA